MHFFSPTQYKNKNYRCCKNQKYKKSFCLFTIKNFLKQKSHVYFNMTFTSAKRDSNSRPSPWQGDALPLSHSRIYYKSAQNRNRTSDTRIFSPLLYQLSYLGKGNCSKLPETGIEPVRVLPRRILSPVRLPVPPLGLICYFLYSHLTACLSYQSFHLMSTTFFKNFSKNFLFKMA